MKVVDIIHKLSFKSTQRMEIAEQLDAPERDELLFFNLASPPACRKTLASWIPLVLYPGYDHSKTFAETGQSNV